jgi:hypothetical protein
MSINIKTEPMRTALLFHKAVLFSPQRIPHEDVPEGWYCYGIRGSIRHPEKPTALSDHVYVNPIGSVLSPVPLKRAETVLRRINGQFLLLGETLTLRDYCRNNNIEYPYKVQIPELRPASPEDAGLFYAQTPEKDEELGAIGHVRIDFGHKGREGFYHTWWPRGPEELNTQEFRDELDAVVNDLRRGVLKDLSSMRRYCSGSEGAIEGGTCCQNYGFTLETERYLYRLRCNPIEGDYQCYLNCFDKQAQQMGLTEKGHQALQDAADPALPHSYDWYVIEHINTPERQVTHQLPLEEAVRLYASLDCKDKRLGVTKDGISSVDLAIHQEGREWLSMDRLKLDSFKDDPVVAGAASQIQKMLDESPAVGRVTFASGERWNYTDPQKHLQTVREELPCHATTGFRCETLTDDPVVRKSVDDMIYDLYGEENPRPLADYGSTGMTMGGMS